MEKLGQLRAQADADAAQPAAWDLIVVDTPPSRSALDFLDAPQRLGSFLDGRLIRLLSAPARAGGRAYLQGGLGGGRRGHRGAHQGARARRCCATCRPSSRRWTPCSAASGSGPRRPTSCCSAPGRRSWWWPPRSRTRCARRRSSSSGWPASGCRWPGWCSTGCSAGGAGLSASRAAGRRRGPGRGAAGTPLTAGLLRLHADRMRRRRAELALAARFTGGPPDGAGGRGAGPAEDVHDLDGLREIGAEPAGGSDRTAEAETAADSDGSAARPQLGRQPAAGDLVRRR